MDPVSLVTAAAPLLQVVVDLIQNAIAGKKQEAQQIKDALSKAVNDCVARIDELAADLARNNATVDAELQEKGK